MKDFLFFSNLLTFGNDKHKKVFYDSSEYDELVFNEFKKIHLENDVKIRCLFKNLKRKKRGNPEFNKNSIEE